VTLLGINMQESAETIQPFLDQLGISYPVLINDDPQVSLNYQVMALLQTLIVDPNGEIVWRQFGPVEFERFTETLASLVE